MPKKKTTVIEKIQRRTPQGKIISEEVTKKVFFDGVPVDETHPTYSTSYKPLPSPGPNFQHHQEPRHSHDLIDCQSDVGTEIIQFKKIPENVKYFDNWQTALVRDAKLVRCDSSASLPSSVFLHPPESDLDAIYTRINHIRAMNDVPVLLENEDLKEEATKWAIKMGSTQRFGVDPRFKNNYWIASRITSKIADEWNQQMRHASQHYFECRGVRYIGLGKARVSTGRTIVVAFYA